MRIAIEIDGAAVHASAGALARDLRRQNAIVLAFASAGWLLLRFSWHDLVAEPYMSQTCSKLREAWSIAGSRPLAAPAGGLTADFADHNS
jgi:very-short-patch-repair endonuclease